MLRRPDPPRSFAEVIDINLLRDWWAGLAAGALIACALAGAYIAVVPPSYEAQVRVVIRNTGLGIQGAGEKPAYDKDFLSTQAEIIRSPATITRSLKQIPHAAADVPDGTVDPVKTIAECLRVNLLADTDIVRLTFEHANPEYAAARLRSIVESYQIHVRSAEQVSATQSAELLARREIELAAQLGDLQQKLLDVRSAATHSVSGESANDSPLLKELTNRWVDVQAELALVESETRASRDGRSVMHRVPSVDFREITALENDLFAARAEATAAAQILGPSHPQRIAAEQRVIVLHAEVGVRKDQIQSERLLMSEQVAAEETSLKLMMVEEHERLRQAGAVRLTEERLQAEIAEVADLHRSTVAALESVHLADRTLAEGRSSIFVDVIDEFTVPKTPIWPKPTPLIAVSAMLGALLALAVAVVVESRRMARAAAVPAERMSNATSEEDSALAEAERIQQEVEAHVRPRFAQAGIPVVDGGCCGDS